MYINQIFEFSMVLNHERFHKVFKRAYSKDGFMENREDEYIDRALEEKGITVIYRDSQYKKKIKLIVNVGRLLKGGEPDPDRIVRKLNKHIGEYFEFKYNLEDFSFSEMRFVTDINVESRENVQAYLQVFRRIGKVKGFSPTKYECLEAVDSFCLNGNSNGIEFMIYGLEDMCRKQFKNIGTSRKRLKTIIKESEGVLRAEVNLTKPKAIRDYTDAEDTLGQIMELSEKCQDIFLEIFVQVVPFGNYYKKDKAVELIRSRVGDVRLRRKMLRLVALIPEKKSLYLAQKAMNCRNIEKVMKAYAKTNISPVTISKRQNVKQLINIYEYLCK